MMNKETILRDEIIICPKCESNHLITDHVKAEVICNDCGLVIDEDIIDNGPEWRIFDGEQHKKRIRTGSPMTYAIHDKGLSTAISWKNRDSYGKYIPNKNRWQINRLRKWQIRIQDNNGKDRNLISALSAIDRMSSNLNLPRNVREIASLICRKSLKNNLGKGKGIDRAAASIYAACRQCNIPRTLNEISKASQISKIYIGRNYRMISKGLKLKLLPTMPQDYIPRFCSKLKLSYRVQLKSLELINKYMNNKSSTFRALDPVGLAGGSIYFASLLCDEKITQAEISKVTNVTEATIRRRYKEISEKLSLEIKK